MNLIKRILKKIKRICLDKETIVAEKIYVDKEYFINELLKYDVISFDIFDTLITRKIYSPDDIFEILNNEFKKELGDTSFLELRKSAEREANLKLQHDVNLDEIYDNFKCIKSLNKKVIDKMKNMETKLELELCFPKYYMIEIMEELKKSGKKVILVSDMYLREDTIISMLKKCGIKKSKHYDKFYLSNALNKRKDSGTMWDYLSEIYDKEKIIHVGDNYNSDYVIPCDKGFNAFYLSNARDLAKKCDIYNVVEKYNDGNISNSLYLGYMINCVLFNSSFNGNIIDVKQLAKMFHAPMLYQFFNFINSNIRKGEKLLFLAREGYYLEKLYDIYNKNLNIISNEHYYFLASRKATISCVLNSIDAINESLNREYNGSLSSLLKNTYDINYEGKDFKVTLPFDSVKIQKILVDYYDEIIKNSTLNKENYLKYISSIFDIKKDKVCILDLGYSGTIQYNLSKIMQKDFKGIYLTNSDSVKRYSDKSELLFCFDINDNENYSKIYNYSLILEFFLTAPYGQLIKFEQDGNKVKPVYNDDTLSIANKEFVQELYDGVVDFFNDMKEMNDIYKLDFSNALLADMYISIVESNLIDRSVKDRFSFIDSFNKSEEENVFKTIDRY